VKEFLAEHESRVFQNATIGEVVGECDSLPYIKKILGQSGIEACKKF
jgi:hypothetical protein